MHLFNLIINYFWYPFIILLENGSDVQAATESGRPLLYQLLDTPLSFFRVNETSRIAFSTDYRKEAKSRKYQGVFEVKIRVKTWLIRGIWSQQLEHKQVPQWGTEPGVRKGKHSLLACHAR